MSEYVDFHYMPLEGKITGKQVLKQTEDAINDLGNKVYNLNVDEERIDEAIEKSEEAIDTANSALAAVTTDRAIWKNTVAEMKSTDIDVGITAATRGKDVFNDGSGAFYAVRTKKGGDTDSEDTVFLNNGSVAERIQQFNFIAKGNNIIYVANVADLKSSNAVIDNVYGTAGYYLANDGGSALYNIRAKDVADVDDGGSIIFLDNGNVAELITDRVVNVKQFGAVGDGVEDDYQAITNAVVFASTKNFTLLFPSGNTFYTTTGIVIAKPPEKIVMNSPILYRGNGVALTVGEDKELKKNYTWTFRVINDDTYTAGSCGLKIINAYGGTIYLENIERFETGVELLGSNAGFATNNIFVTKIYNSLTLLKLNSVGTGWCNENKFYGGRYRVDTDEAYKNDAIGILITSENNYRQNANVFYAPNLEDLVNAVHIEHGQLNRFLFCRTEDVTNPLTIDGIQNSNNYMTYTFGKMYNPTYPDCRNLYISDWAEIKGQFNKTLYDSGNIAGNIAKNATYVGVKNLAHMTTSSTLAYKINASDADVTTDGLKALTTGCVVGGVVGAAKNKTFKFSAITDTGCRVLVAMWDVNGVMITDKAPYSVSEVGYVETLTTFSGRSFFSNGADTQPSNYLITVPTECVKVFIGVGRKANCTIKRMTIESHQLEEIPIAPNLDNIVLASIPTSAGTYTGQYVAKEVPTVGEIGWVYDGTQWIAVG